MKNFIYLKEYWNTRSKFHLIQCLNEREIKRACSLAAFYVYPVRRR